MRRAIVVLALIVVGGAGPALAQDPLAEKEIRRIVAAQATAWDAGDGTSYAVDLALEASFTNLFGMVMYGAPAPSATGRSWPRSTRARPSTTRSAASGS